MFLLKMLLFKRSFPLLFVAARIACILFAGVFVALFLIQLSSCASPTKPEKDLRAQKAEMFRKHNTGTTQAIQGLGKALGQGYPRAANRKLQPRSE